ncbi:hypothetical protein NHH03_27595 [Stieleria sp. TO1_6]|uniref:hypothetical protein n=1 Tax=Stieleria tagensis TaxID=2956795 RepID=UPI00209BAC07|nr:hypothetical protein [Stieleria tagensis]MCO8125534.1 hypothetical protein [Stieleria tagensis]
MKQFALEQGRRAVADDKQWAEYLDENLFRPPPAVSAHLGVFVEPFLGYVLDGTKTIESRFSLNQCDPFGSVSKGDIVLVKEAAGPVVGLCRVSTVWSYVLDPESLNQIRSLFGSAMRVESESFWAERTDAAFATLMQIDHVTRIQPFTIEKKDRRGWVVLRRRSKQLMLWEE